MPGPPQDIAAGPVEDLDLRLAETVDALLGVADGEEPAAVARIGQGVEDFALHLVDVLELVHHQVVDAVDGRLHALVARLRAEQALCQPLQVVEIEGRQLCFESIIDRR